MKGETKSDLTIFILLVGALLFDCLVFCPPY